jgi:hypothetical protein
LGWIGEATALGAPVSGVSQKRKGPMRDFSTEERAGNTMYGQWSSGTGTAFCSRCGAPSQMDHAFCPRCGAALHGSRDLSWRRGPRLPYGIGGLDLDAIMRHPSYRPLLYAAGTIFALVLIVEMARALVGLAVVALIVFLVANWARRRECRSY